MTATPTPRWLGAIALVAAALLATWALAPHVPLDPAVGALLAFVFVCAATLAVCAATPPFGVRALGWLVVPVLALVAVALVGARASDVGSSTLVAASLLAAGTIVGSVIAARIQHPSHLFVAACASSLADLYSVFAPRGVTAAVVEHEQLLSVLAIPWPILGTPAIEPLLGVGDVVLCALYVVAARALGLGVRRTVIALALGLTAVLIALVALAVPLPALPFLGVAFVVAHPRTLRFRPGEGRTAAIGLALLAVLFAALFSL